MEEPETDICMGYESLDVFAKIYDTQSDSKDYYQSMIESLRQSKKSEPEKTLNVNNL